MWWNSPEFSWVAAQIISQKGDHVTVQKLLDNAQIDLEVEVSLKIWSEMLF